MHDVMLNEFANHTNENFRVDVAKRQPPNASGFRSELECSFETDQAMVFPICTLPRGRRRHADRSERGFLT